MTVVPFEAWRQDRQQEFVKRVSGGGMRAPISPAAGLYGDRSQVIPPARGYRSQDSRSQYDYDRASQPPNFIDDVDSGQNWYSPLQPVSPFGPPSITRPREFDYPVGYNLNFIQPQIQKMWMLREMARTWGVLATIIATRQDQLLRIPYAFQRKDNPRRSSVGVDEMYKFFRKPDGKKRYSQWSRLVLNDLLVLDAPCLYFWRGRDGRPLRAERIDPTTIFPLIDDAGRTPDSIIELDEDGITYRRRQPAYQQIIKGMPMNNFDETEIMYTPMRPNPAMPMFGYPPTEQILIEVSEAILKTFYQRDFWKEGTIPDLVVTVPDNWSPRHIAMFQAHFDALLSGNLQLKSKVRFLPGGMKPFDVKNSSGESLWSQRDETLIRLACYAYSVSPAPFIKMLNRSTAQNAQQTAEEEGLYPLMSFWKDDIIDPIIQEQFGMEDIEFVFLPRPETDAEKQSKIHQIQVKEGIKNRDEVRGELGLEPIPGGDVYMIELGNIIVPLESAADGDAAQAQSGFGDSGSPSPSSKPSSSSPSSRSAGARPSKPKSPSPKSPTNPTGTNPQRGAVKPGFGPSRAAKFLGNDLTDALLKIVSSEELESAVSEASGDVADHSHLELHYGNYKKGHIWIQGLNISVENAPGSTRGEKDANGIKWSVKMPSAYGYICGTIGADEMQIDCYLGKNPDSKTVWVIDQDMVSPKGKILHFDEHKCMICYNDLATALSDYLVTHFDGKGQDRLDKVTELSMGDFKTWLKSGDLHLPISDQDVGKVVLKRKHLQKLGDTVSQTTNLLSYNQDASAPKKKKKKKRISSGPRWLSLSAQT